jgi:phosphotransferase system enzyme I (PtsI)
MQRLSGLGVSAGVAVGRALVWRWSTRDLRYRVNAERIPAELARLAVARSRSRRQLEEIRSRIATRAGAEHSYLFDAQLLMLDDPMLLERAEQLIGSERLNAEWAVQQAYEELAAIFGGVEDPYLRERRGDVADVVGRLHLNLRRSPHAAADLVRELREPHVLVADDLTPSMAAQLDWSILQGFVTDAGSWTYHTAILSRSLHVPAVVGLRDASRRIPPGTLIAIDGGTGEVLIDPAPAAVAELQSRVERRAAYERTLDALRDRPAVTTDGVRIRLEANIERTEDLARVREAGAEGIGLYRSEFLLAAGENADLSEDAQYAAYRAVVEGMAPAPVTIRTFDVGEAYFRIRQAGPTEADRLGLRAIRFSLAAPDVFRTQLRALVRASRHGRLRVLFPFVSGLGELREARHIFAEETERLGIAHTIPVGVMVEVPSAALTVDLIAREVDFLSVGTNDLIQYTLAVDRTDERVSHLYEPLHPAILRTIRRVWRVGRRYQVPVSICGEMASDPVLLTLLIGLGITEVSMTPAAIPPAKQVIQGVHRGDAQRAARDAMRASTGKEVERVLLDYLARSQRRATVNE